MGCSLQKRIEDKSNQFFKKIIEEFNISFNEFPKIFWIDDNTKFKDIQLKGKNKEDFDYVKKSKKAICNPHNYGIFIGTDSNYILGEEIGHYIHFKHAKFKKETSIGDFYFGALSEMIGYFSSKLINLNRKNEFDGANNPLEEITKINELFEYIHENQKENFEFNENLIYINGYSMGEKMFEKYKSGQISKKEIHHVFTNHLDSEIETVYQFYRWKNELLK